MSIHSRLMEKVALSNSSVSNSSIYTLMVDNDCISRVEPIHDIDTDLLVEIFFNVQNSKLANELIRNGITLSNGQKIKVKVNLKDDMLVAPVRGMPTTEDFMNTIPGFSQSNEKSETPFGSFKKGFLNRSNKASTASETPKSNAAFETSEASDNDWLRSQFSNLSTSEQEEANKFSKQFKPAESYSNGMSQEDFNTKMQMDPIFRRMFSQS